MRANGLEIVALSGGVGGAKLAMGLARTLPAKALLVVANVGDDFDHLGLSITPDIDTIIYTIAGLNNWGQGWGRADESWNFMDTIGDLGGEDWFQLGDRDLALHVWRTDQLRRGATLSTLTAAAAERLGVTCTICPSSDLPIRTILETAEGELDFQRYFVRRRAEPEVRAIQYRGAETAVPSPLFMAGLSNPSLRATIICPSNPVLSIGPIIAMDSARKALVDAPAPVIAVSPIKGESAFKGPTARNMRNLGMTPNALGVARYYQPLIDGMVIDHADAALAPAIREMGIAVAMSDISMPEPEDCERLARDVLAIVDDGSIRKRSR
ncbi:2-phospho-L-lactate transferase [Aminobacter niigataensis]|uniref:2-phospho-L-lactate transferase n=1 Tax=Aminobacter niigataensis TaxID=83265 RepID=UPI0024CD0163|nr:2-phospho-L-lactate transferase [Aminobacter niigataensis]CAI2931850.1 Lactyl (2) diphospho-(5')guanosine:7, 8-didemethyl-8-hydroxy-5-deazariboflavin 2-phospho-L-lactate transferase [Aminobacter niigataensis]